MLFIAIVGTLFGAEALLTQEVVVSQKDSFSHEVFFTLVARETTAVPEPAFERYVARVFFAEACVT